jgi:FMN-dependent oxidoreductase (nitrilotriacetate monooxygenase family)
MVLRRPLTLAAFVMATNSHTNPGVWRKPQAKHGEFGQSRHWVDLAKLLDGAGFEMLIFADVMGLYGEHDGSHDVFARHGLQVPTLDPSVLLPLLAWETEQLGFVVTSSIFQEHPFAFARKMSTLDELTGGRVGWNIVTGHNANAYSNFGYAELPPHDERYRWADEYLSVVYKLWEGSWEDGAVVGDRAGGMFADADKIHRIWHHGQRYKVEGPHLVHPTPQRTPLLVQAGSSPAGKEFAARNVEVAILDALNPDAARKHVAEARKQLSDNGRTADDLHFLQVLSIVVSSTEAEAARKSQELDEWVDDDAVIAQFGGSLGIDLGGIGPDTPLENLESDGVQSLLPLLRGVAGDRPATLRDVVSTRKRNRAVGTPEQIADKIQQWYEAGIDGLCISNALIPDDYRDFIDEVLPLLTSRGLLPAAPAAVESNTLRGRMFGSDRLRDRHPAARQRSAFTGNSLRDGTAPSFA